jgi:hypothetical protein
MMISENRTIGRKDVAVLLERIEDEATDDFLAARTDKRPLGDFLNSMATYTGASRAAKEIKGTSLPLELAEQLLPSCARRTLSNTDKL